MRKIILLFIVSFICQAALAQSPYKSRLGRFQVDQKKGCAPFTVTITDTNLITVGDCTPGKPCNMDFEGNGQQKQNVFTYTYTTPGTYKLSILYQSIGPDDITITVDQNIQPNFDMYSCNGSKVEIKVTDNNYDQYVIDFQNDNTPETVIPFSNNAIATFDYVTPGTRTIYVRGRDLNSADQCNAKTQAFNAIATLPATTISTLTAVDAANVKLNFATQPNVLYHSEIGINSSGTFQLYQPVFGVTTLNVPNLKVDDNYYCFRLGSFDPCTNTNATYSNIICSQNFDLVIKSGVNTLNWATSTTGIASMTYVRKKNNAIDVSLTRPSATPLTMDDTDAICKTDYCYTLTSNYANGSKSISLDKCGTAFDISTPPAVDNVSAIVIDPGVDLTWVLADPTIVTTGFTVSRSVLTGAAVPVGTVTAMKFSDPSYQIGFNFCYTVNYTDNCDNKSAAGSLVCPVQLFGSLNAKTNVVSLKWSKYSGWNQGIKTYTVEKYGLGNKLIQKFDVGTDTLFVDDQPDPNNQFVLYKIVVSAVEAGITTSISNSVSFVKETHLITPTAFTPNGDNLNDSFTITGQYIVKMSLSIFDRWGALIFTTEKNEPWNGKRSGALLPEGAYVWKADISNLAGQNFNRTGTVMLLTKP